MVGEVLEHPEQDGAFEEGEISGTEVVEHRAERLRADRGASVEAPGAVQVEGRADLGR
jgi:hypothetical protein